MKRFLLLLWLAVLPVLGVAGEKIAGKDELELPLTDATSLIEDVLGTDWATSTSRYSFFSLDVPKEQVFAAAVQTSLVMGFIPIVCDYNAGVLVVTSTPQQALSGSVFQAFLFEEAVDIPNAKRTTFVTMRTKYLYFSKYLGWNTDSSTGSIYHKLGAILLAMMAKTKGFTSEVIERAVTDPETTLQQLEELLKKR